MIVIVAVVLCLILWAKLIEYFLHVHFVNSGHPYVTPMSTEQSKTKSSSARVNGEGLKRKASYEDIMYDQN